MTKQQKRKQHIRAFMQAHYTDELLAQLLAHAQDGKLAYVSCCCFIGIPTADHPLKGYVPNYNGTHYDIAYNTLETIAGVSYANLSSSRFDYEQQEADRRRILIPIIRAEQRRRERSLDAQPEVSAEIQRVAEPVEIA